MTLEYASADFALAQFAKALGDETDYADAHATRAELAQLV